MTPRPSTPLPSKPGNQGFLPFGILTQKPLLWLGFGALLGWADLLLCFEGVLRDTVTEKGGLVHDPLFLGLTGIAGCVLLLMAQGHRLGPNALRRMSPIATLLGAAGSLTAVVLTAVAEAIPSWMGLLLGGVVGICIALLTLVWAQVLSRLDLRAALLVVSAGACAQWALLVIVTITGLWVHGALAVAVPLLAGWSALRSQSVETPNEEAPSTPSSQAAPALWRLASAMGVFSLVAQFVWCFFIKMLHGKLEPSLFVLVFMAVIVAVALAVCGCSWVMERQKSYRLELCYRLAFLVCLGGIGATGIAAADLTQGELFASYTAVYVGYSLLGPTMWMLALGYGFMRSASIQRVGGAVFGAQYLGLFLGFVLVEGLITSPWASQGQRLGPLVVLLGVCALGAAYVALFPERSLLGLSPRLFGLSPASIEDRCAHVAETYALTPRETQVLALLARGRDVGFICDELGIARNTVNVHRKGIFAKLNIHSQQELLSVVEKASEE